MALRGKPARPTIVDVAEAAGVSRQTVSNAVNSPHRVAPKTLDRVNQEIERLQFRPSQAARSLRRRKAHALGIQLNSRNERSLGNVLDPFLVEAVVASRRHDTHLITFAVDPEQDLIAEYEHLVAARLVDGFVLVNTGHGDPRPEWLRRRGVPFASFGRIWDDPSFTNWVDVDGAWGTSDAVDHLFQQGYQRIGFLGWPTGSAVGDERRAGWLASCQDRDRLDVSLQASSIQDVTAAARAAEPLVARLGTGDAIVCASDTLALGVYTVLRDRQVAVGPDFGLVGFDDTDVAQALEISSVSQPLSAIAEAVLDLAVGEAGDDICSRPGVLMRPAVVVRQSSTRISKAVEDAGQVPAGEAKIPGAANRAQHGGSR